MFICLPKSYYGYHPNLCLYEKVFQREHLQVPFNNNKLKYVDATYRV